MRPIIVLLCIILFSIIAFSQKEDYVWLGGTQPYPDGLRADGHIIDFGNNNGKPKRQDIRYGFVSNNTSISDDEGNLLFYFNGCAVMNKNHQVMPNGNDVNTGEWFDKIWGGNCMYGYPGFQECIILKDPLNDQGYYLIHTSRIYYPIIADSAELKYSYIDMTMNNGFGDVTIKNKKIYDRQNICNSYLTAIQHKNKKDWWLIQPIESSQEFLLFSINSNGIIRYGNQLSFHYFDRERSNSSGTSKFSPDGTKFAFYNYYDQLHIYDFDRSSGELSNHQKIEIYDPDSINREDILFSSVEWSPNSRFVYCSSSNKLHQVDMWETNPQDGVRHIADYNGTLDPFTTRLFLMAQAPDCKIYMSPKNGSYSIHVINKPNELGQACDFVQNGIKLPAQNSGTLPNFPRFRVDEADKCDPTISSIFGEDVYYRRDIEIYPSPSYGVYQLRMPEGASDGHIVVTDIYGKIIYQTEINSYEHITEIDITSKPSGNYNIEYYPRINPERVFYGRQVVKI